MSELEYMTLMLGVVNESRFLYSVKASIVPLVNYKILVHEEIGRCHCQEGWRRNGEIGRFSFLDD